MNKLAIRTLTAIVYLLVMLAAMFTHPTVFFCVFFVIALLCLNEFYDMTAGKGQSAAKLGAFLTFTVFYSASTFVVRDNADARWLLLGLLPLFLTSISCFFAQGGEYLRELAYIFTGLLYIGLPFCLFPLLMFRNGEFSGLLMFSCFIMIWASDIGAYALGMALGQKENARKLAPSISPHKSWWGFWGGIILCLAAATGLYFLGWTGLSLGHCLALSVIISGTGVCGDLFESVWKRAAGLKDSGKLLPGHGGMLDRFDSAIFALSAAIVYLSLFDLL